MDIVIRDKVDLSKFIAENGESFERTYLVQDVKTKLCYALFGVGSAEHGFVFVNENYDLVISDDDYSDEIERQSNSSCPEDEGFFLK